MAEEKKEIETTQGHGVDFSHIHNPLIDRLKREVETRMRKVGLNMCKSTLTRYIACVMEVIEESQVSKGVDKKKLALTILRELVELVPVGEDGERKKEKEIVLELIKDGTLSDMIDLVVSATRGELNINRAVSVTSRCCVKFFR
jgi:hypothetical protein